MNFKYLRPGFEFCLSHVISECGEVLHAAGKLQQWGAHSVNPEIPPQQRETNLVWLRREIGDLKGAIDRLEAEIQKEFGE